MAKSKKKTVIALKCEETGQINYHVYKPNNIEGKLRVKKYCPKLRKHTWHIETKAS